MTSPLTSPSTSEVSVHTPPEQAYSCVWPNISLMMICYKTSSAPRTQSALKCGFRLTARLFQTSRVRSSSYVSGIASIAFWLFHRLYPVRFHHLYGKLGVGVVRRLTAQWRRYALYRRIHLGSQSGSYRTDSKLWNSLASHIEGSNTALISQATPPHAVTGTRPQERSRNSHGDRPRNHQRRGRSTR